MKEIKTNIYMRKKEEKEEERRRVVEFCDYCEGEWGMALLIEF